MRFFVVTFFLALTSCGDQTHTPNPQKVQIVQHYADMAFAIYDDSLKTANTLSEAVDQLIAAPSTDTLQAARMAWVKARMPYMQSEAFRFGNPIVDGFDMKLNAWPLDESFIDYIAPSPLAAFGISEADAVNVITNEVISYGGKDIDATELNPDFLSGTLHELGGNEAFVATGFHAVEFLLWGQDLVSDAKQAGRRPATDFDLENCSNPPCARRIEYLKSAMQVLIADLNAARNSWDVDGAARLSLTTIPPDKALGRMFHGLGSLAYGELAGERMKLGLMLKDPEEEHDCFSDNTHNAHYFDALGIKNVWTGQYKRHDGSLLSGPSLSTLTLEADPELAARISDNLDQVMKTFEALRIRGETIEHYDQMITGNNPGGQQIIEAAISALIIYANSIERAAIKLDLAGLAFEGSESLDAPELVKP